MKITAIRTTPMSIPLREGYHMRPGSGNGITTVLVEVETDDGTTGYGETCGWIAAEGIAAMYKEVERLFVGESPYDVERLFARAAKVTFMNVTPRFGHRLLAGLEMAAWDLIGKAAGQPVHRLLGGAAHDRIGYFGFPQGDTADELAASARRIAAAGFSVFYLKAGRGEAADLANAAAVREAIGPRCRLRLDANEAWDVLTAVRMIGLLRRFDPEFIEQPTPNHSVEALRQVKESVDVPISADQCVLTPADVYEVCRRRAADLIVLGPHETGGLLGLKKAAAIAEAAGINVCMHGVFETGITTCAANQILATIPNLDDGNQIMCQLLEHDVVAAPQLVPEGGSMGVIEGPGLGFELDRDAVKAAHDRYCKQGQYWLF